MASWFGKKEEESKSSFAWQELESSQSLDEIIERSEVLPQILFKHSTRCIISRSVLKNFEADWKGAVQVDLNFLDLLSHREVSSAIADRTGIHHESPQLIILHKKRAVWDRSHHNITASDVEAFLKGLST